MRADAVCFGGAGPKDALCWSFSCYPPPHPPKPCLQHRGTLLPFCSVVCGTVLCSVCGMYICLYKQQRMDPCPSPATFPQTCHCCHVFVATCILLAAASSCTGQGQLHSHMLMVMFMMHRASAGHRASCQALLRHPLLHQPLPAQPQEWWPQPHRCTAHATMLELTQVD